MHVVGKAWYVGIHVSMKIPYNGDSPEWDKQATNKNDKQAPKMGKQNLSDLISIFDHLALFQLPSGWEVFENNYMTIGSPSLKEFHRPLF